MIKKFKNLLIILSVFSVLLFALFNISFAQSGLVPCGTEKTPVVPGPNGTETGGDIINPCGFNDIFTLINTIVNFMLFVLAIPIAAIIFAVAGFKLLFSGGSPGKMAEAKSSMINVAIGLAIAAGAWVIIHTLLGIVGYNGITFGL